MVLAERNDVDLDARDGVSFGDGEKERCERPLLEG